jgi:hypothetical protein
LRQEVISLSFGDGARLVGLESPVSYAIALEARELIIPSTTPDLQHSAALRAAVLRRAPATALPGKLCPARATFKIAIAHEFLRSGWMSISRQCVARHRAVETRGRPGKKYRHVAVQHGGYSSLSLRACGLYPM